MDVVSDSAGPTGALSSDSLPVSRPLERLLVSQLSASAANNIKISFIINDSVVDKANRYFRIPTVDDEHAPIHALDT